jgi:hypothetical protein
LARTVSTEAARAELLAMAGSWARLAEEQDDPSADIQDLVPPTTAEEARPAVQQQQQVQPKGDEEKE